MECVNCNAKKCQKGDGMGAKKKIEIRKVSRLTIRITIVLALLFAFFVVQGESEFGVLKEATTQYIQCEKAVNQLRAGSDYLTEQVRLYAMTGEIQYMNAYFTEVNETKSRENALEVLKDYYDKTATFIALKNALKYSDDLMQTEYYSMRLVCEANALDQSQWPEEIQAVTLTKEDEALSAEGKRKTAQNIVCDETYQQTKNQITENVESCADKLIQQTRKRQGRATTFFSNMYLKLKIGIVVMVILMLVNCVIVCWLVVKPLVSYNESIKQGEIFPVIGAAELQNLAVTYNQVYLESQETEKLIRHEAEHDPLTDLLNRGSFDKLLRIYDTGDSSFAMIIVDVDTFKQVNDTFGHAIGDQILKKVASILKTQFRSIDYVCRIGGDEFAIIMVEMTSDLQYTIQNKIDEANKELFHPTDGLPAVSLSVGVAFSDRKNPSGTIFNDADSALYYVKEHGRHGCGFYGQQQETDEETASDAGNLADASDAADGVSQADAGSQKKV